MTFADLIYKAWCAVSAHRTKLVGTATSVVAFLAMNPNIVPQRISSECEFAMGLLTILCGVANTSTIAAKVAAIQNPTQPQTGAQSESTH